MDKKRIFDIERRPLPLLIALAVILCLVSESLARRSPVEALRFFADEPLSLLYNSALIFLPLSLCLLVRRRIFAVGLISAVVLGLSIADFIIQCYRTAPLTAIDFALMSSVSSIVRKYLSVWQIALLVAVAALVAVCIILGFRRCPRLAPRRGFAAVVVLTAYLAVTVGYAILRAAVPPPESEANASDIADRYGYAYCFAVSLFDRGVSRPRDYSEQSIDSILEELSHRSGTETEEHPNIIFLQLESFFDVNRLRNVRFESEPLPVFSELEENFPSGQLIVPSLATGTANTEFEVLTGMSLDYFGVGEYPYQTVLQDETCESIAYNMKALGYTAHAIHDHSGDFYDRQNVFANLGFDTFTSVEYMQNVERNENGWAKDKVLTAEILKALGSTQGEDLIYAISVQAHGQYPDGEGGEDMPAFGEGTSRASFEYYLSQIQEMDALLGELTDALERYGRPVVLVMFGDHLPGLGLSERDLRGGSLYETQYVIWSNFGLDAPDKDINAYQLTAYVQSLLGMESGIFTKLHQRLALEPDYQKSLELLQYDYLYGDIEIFDGSDPYERTDLQMGAVPVRLTSLTQGLTGLIVRGSGFTEYSRVFVNDREVECGLVNGALICPDTELSAGDSVRVAQISESSGSVLSSTYSLIWRDIASPIR